MVRSYLLLGIAFLLVPAHTGASTPAGKLSAHELAGQIDKHLAARLAVRKITPAPVADDAEFVRRVHLDLSGCIPDLIAARDFIENPLRDKRERLIDRLLSDDRYSIHWANVWRAWLIPDSSDRLTLAVAPSFEPWMRGRLKDNTRYNDLVRELVAGSPISGKIMMNTEGGTAFYLANQQLPENLAAATSRLFLGVKLECAQCHNHPFAKWKRQQFWELAAFFPTLAALTEERRQLEAGKEVSSLRLGEIRIPGTDKVVKARLLDGKEAKWSDDPRTALIDWMVARDNPFFARALANRLWEYFFGLGLVEPIAEESAENPPSHPELLDLLARQFFENNYDLKYLIKAILLSRGYQRTSRQTHPDQADARLFARQKVRGLSSEQLYDSLVLATGRNDEPSPRSHPRERLDLNNPRVEFLRRFPSPDKRAEQQTSILQALYLMNGKIVTQATSLQHNRNLQIIAEGKGVRTSRRIEQLFLIALSRKPTPAESTRFVKYVDRGGPSNDSAQALCDVFWALLNSSEFCVNH